MGQNVRLIGLILLVIVLAVLGYRGLFGERPAHDLMVVSANRASIQGLTYGDSTGLEPGQIVGVNDVVKTAANGSAALQYGDGAQVMLSEATVMRVLNADATGVQIDLGEGEVTARVRQGAPPLDIVTKSRTIRGSDADFTVMVTRDGGFSTMAQRGQISVLGSEGGQSIRSGVAVHSQKGGALLIEPVTENLLLDVEWPEETRTRLSEVEVSGQTDPYATVTVGTGPEAVRVRSDRDGRFRATVKLREGENEVTLKVRDVAGREAIRVQKVRRDSTAPVMQAAEVVWGP